VRKTTPPDLSLLTEDFERRPAQAYSHSQLAQLQASHLRQWGLPERMGARAFIQLLMDQKKLSPITLRSPDYSEIVRYTWRSHQVSPLAVALSIRKSAYLSHSTALWIHGLGGNARHLIVNVEQSEKDATNSNLTQEAIDRAFQNEVRRSRLVYAMTKLRITVINGKNTGELEVQQVTGTGGETLRVTSLERTLVDIVVRPIYSGGVQSVLDAYRFARDRISVPKTLQILQKLNYLYPYHQAIGFYLQAAGYSSQDQALFKHIGMKYDFYLSHGLKRPMFDKRWRVFYPRGLRHKAS
jgi:hypothetical protein